MGLWIFARRLRRIVRFPVRAVGGIHGEMKTHLPLIALALSLSMASCSGKTVVEVPAGGGAGAAVAGKLDAGGTGGGDTGAGGSGGSGGGTGGAPSCEALRADLDAKILAARACTSDEMGPAGCDGTAVVVDSCGCGKVVNALQPAAFGAASAASDAAMAAGCIEDCGFDCWYSEATSWLCSPTKSNGWLCTPFLGD